MEKERETCPASDVKTVTTTDTTTDLFSQGFLSSLLDENQNLEDDFRSMYDSIFPPKSSITPSANEQHRLNRARLILEYQQLCDHYDLCFSRLQAVSREVEALRQENSDLRLANTELLKLLNNSFHSLNDDISSGFSPKSVMEPSQFEKENVRETVVERDSLPKSISVRSAGYLKANPTKARIGPSRQRVQRVHVPAAGREEQKALEFEVYNQGMWKTELCNKWQETGTCPYGDQCQFAHGITELRPVIRHPRYKTEICRMVLVGDTCPYGHRCHFRHSLTEQERLMLPR